MPTLPPQRYRSVTIDHSKVQVDLTDFPVLISGTFPELAAYTFGGHISDATSAHDLVVYSDSALSTKLDFELESWTPSSGDIALWVRVPNLSSSVNTVIYLAYGGPGPFTDQSNKSGVWSSFATVYHMSDPVASPQTMADATGHTAAGTTSGGITPGASGKVGKSFALDNINIITLPNSLRYFANVITISCWIKLLANGAGFYVDKRHTGGVGSDLDKGYKLSYDSSTSTLKFLAFSTDDSQLSFSHTLDITTGDWHHIVVTYDGTVVKLYDNGSQLHSQNSLKPLALADATNITVGGV